MYARTEKKYLNTITPLLVAAVLFSCGKKEDLETRRTQLLQGDMSNVPKALKVDDVQTQDFGKLKLQMYGLGCKEAGSAIPVLKPHPQLKPGQIFVIQSSRANADKKFQLGYDLRTPPQPANWNENIILQGQINQINLSEFYDAVVVENDKRVQKKCSLMGANSQTENCYDLDINYSKEFISQYNKTFKDDVECLYGDTDIAPTEKWSEGQLVLQNSKPIKVYAHTLQTTLNRACRGEKDSTKVVKTLLRVTSNDVVANQYSYCGGTVVYEKEVLRDYKTNEIINQQTHELKLAPLVEE